MRKRMLGIAWGLLAAATALWAAYGITGTRGLYIAGIAVSVTLYHFAMRLAVGAVIDRRCGNRLDGRGPWFQEKGWEAGLYRRLRVQNWKRHLPAFQPELFDLARHSLDEVIGAMCQAEVVHEIIMALSFAPLLLSLAVGDFPVFLITSLLAAVMDGLFVILQRYNRPRLLHLQRRREERARRNAREEA